MTRFTGNKFKFTVQELDARHVGKNICPSGSPEDRDRWKIKKATYTDEGMWGFYVTLRDSIRPLLIRPDGFVESDLAAKFAQIMIDNFLVRRVNGEDVRPPKQLVPVNARPDEKAGIELFDAEDFTDDSGVTENEKIRWCYENMRKSGVEMKDAPSIGAFGMLMHYRKNDARQEKFYDTMVPKLMTKEDAEKSDKLKDKGKEIIELIDRLIKAAESEAVNEQT